MVAQELYGVGGRGAFGGTSLQDPASSRECRRNLAGIHGAQAFGNTIEVFGFHARGGQVVSDIVGDGRQVWLRLAE